MQEGDNESLNSSASEVFIVYLQELRYGTGSEAPPRRKRRDGSMLNLEKVSKELVLVMTTIMLLMHQVSLLRLKCLKSVHHSALNHKDMLLKHYHKVAHNYTTARCFICWY